MAARSTDPIERLLAFEGWANARLYAAVKHLPPENNKRALTLLAHIANGMRVWYERIAQINATAEPWRDLTLEETGTELKQYLDALSAIVRDRRKQLHQLISYRNTKGQPFETPLIDILQHLSFHSHYHRGQINSAIREAGASPVDVDFITFQREGH
jgi:uncharacterized damage-inducible protein DinB